MLYPSCSAATLQRVMDGPKGAWSLWRCSTCSAYPVFPVVERKTDLYGKDYFERGEAPSDPSYSGYLSYDRHRAALKSDVADQLRPHIGSSFKILDIGCATGTALEAARELGVSELQLTGIDISRYAIERARSFLPCATFILGDIETVDFDQTYDLILLLDVLEHVHSPARLFERAAASLNPGGRIIVSTPDPESLLRRISGAAWSEFHPGEHVCFLSRTWFSWATKRTDLAILECRRQGRRITLEHLASRARAYIPFFPQLRSQRMISLNTRDQLFVVCEKAKP